MEKKTKKKQTKNRNWFLGLTFCRYFYLYEKRIKIYLNRNQNQNLSFKT